MAGKKRKPEKKYYTVAEANAALPLVRAIIGDVTRLAPELRQHYERLRELMPDETRINESHWEEISHLQGELDRDQEQLNGYFAELQKLGVELKDPFTGLLDFPCWMDNREVYLCWRQGEPEVGHWHELDAGFAGRQKISPAAAGTERIGYPREVEPFADLHRSLRMPELVAYLLLFLVVGAGFILVHLLVGKLIRPAKPHDEKLTIYECGEPTIGSAWVQFDVRFYVVALLFVIFDVEVAFFFPWAVVFGGLTNLAQGGLTDEQRLTAAYALETGAAAEKHSLLARKQELLRKQQELAKATEAEQLAELKQIPATIEQIDAAVANLDRAALQTREPAHRLAWIAMLDIAVFFGVLLVGFAYLWRRGDVQWVRSTAAEQPETAGMSP